MMFICELCSFCTTTRREWNNHKKKTGHALATQPSDDRDEEDLASDSEMDFPVQQEVLNVDLVNEAFWLYLNIINLALIFKYSSVNLFTMT